MKKLFVLFSVLLLMLTACSGTTSTTQTASSTGTGVISESYTDALPASSQLALGTIRLKDTAQAVTKEQAAAVLPLWQALKALSSSASVSQTEVSSLIQQIQAGLKPAQLLAIADVKLTTAQMQTALQELGTTANPASGTQVARTPNAANPGGGPGGAFGGGPGGGGGMPPDGVGPGGVPGAGLGGVTGTQTVATLSPAIQATANARATQKAQFGNPMLLNAVIAYLEQVIAK